MRILGPVLFGLIVLEVLLRLYNPLPFRVRGDRIVLPVNQSYRFTNTGSKKLDAVTYHTKNSLGFRGPEPPADWSSRLTILTIGGSTTECLFLSDGKTWTDELAKRVAAVRPDAWVNNAGLDGQSTFGHLILLRDFVSTLRPRVAVFLIGINDVGRGDPTGFDVALLPQSAGRLHHAATWISERSTVAALAQNLLRVVRTHRAGFGHFEIDMHYPPRGLIDEPEMERILNERARRHLDGYRDRVRQIVASSRAMNVQAVLVTQPALYGGTIDPTSGVDLTVADVDGTTNGILAWRILELFNDVTREVGRETGTPVIDLAREMPKDSRYFYDYLHFTNEGAVRVGDIVFAGLEAHLPPPRRPPD